MKIIGLFIFLFGVITLDFESLPWAIFGLLLFAFPLILQFTRFSKMRVWILSVGIVLVVQAILSPFLYILEYKIWVLNSKTYTLQPNMNYILDVRRGIHGIDGPQSITTDAKGFRITRAVDYNSDKTFRIFAIGGSTSDQTFLDDRATWTHLLQERLALTTGLDVEVVNAGVTGLRLQHHVWTLRNIIDLHPDIVLFLIGINDWNQHIKEMFSKEARPLPLRVRAAMIWDDMRLRNTLLGKITFAIYAMMSKNEILTKVEYGDTYAKERGSLNRTRVFSFHPDTVHPEYIRHLSEISDICRSKNIKCVFITQPTGYQEGIDHEFRNALWMTPPYDDYTLDFGSMIYIASLYNDFLVRFARENNHYVCDAASALVPGFENFYDDCHFNTQGARNMSVIVGKCLEDVLLSGGAGSD